MKTPYTYVFTKDGHSVRGFLHEEGDLPRVGSWYVIHDVNTGVQMSGTITKIERNADKATFPEGLTAQSGPEIFTVYVDQ